MREKLMKYIIWAMVIGILGFAYYLYVADWKNPKATFIKEEPQPYVTAEVDSTILRRKLFEQEKTDSILAPSRTLLVAVMDTDSMRINLNRPLQEVVTIDMEEHKEAVFFTWDDIKSYYHAMIEYFEKKRKK